MPRLSKLGAAALAAFGWTSGSAVSASYLVVAGGGGGGRLRGGGGGAGGLRTGTLSLNPASSYTVTVGAGGAGSTVATAKGSSGSDSIFSTITSTGGGGGGSPGSGNAAIQVGSNGGSGGGGATDNVTGTVSGAGGSGNTPSTSPSQGSNGGSSTATTQYGAGGGGGASAAGSNGLTSGGAAGGAGTASSITGSSVTYAGGGGGGAQSGSAGAGGSGGGGAGGVGSNAGSNGTANLGGGGGGDGNPGTNGGAGGSGIVIISYAGAQQFGGGVITTDGTNTIHTFTTSGTLVPVTPLTASALVVAGGGGASGSSGGGGAGGGAGGFRTATGLTIDTNSTYLVTVGAGGAAPSPTFGTAVTGNNGSNSSFLATTSTGGGGGGASGTNTNGNSGGSGGGGGYGTGTGGAGNTPSTSPSQGSNGGAATGGAGGGGGGGGGASAVGGNGAAQTGGNGGAGSASSISGTSVTYAGGGGGGGNTTKGTGGAGGGGNGGTSATPLAGTAGTANTGGGGGGGYSDQAGAAGGSGIVIISYPGSTQQMAGGTVTITGGNVIHTFTSSGYLAPIKLVSNSLRFRSSASAYLNRTPASASNQTTWTLSMWVKRGSLSGVLGLFNAGATATTAGFVEIDFQSDSTLIFYSQLVGTNVFVTTQVFRDPAAWYHLVFAVDTTQATASNRVKLYVNGVQVTSFSSTSYPAQNSSTAVNSTGRHVIGSSNTSGGGLTSYFDGYMTEINLIDGQALTPNSFGTINSYGVWQPITYGGSYGTNGFYLPFTNNTSTTTLGYDFSPNGNNWTTNNISLTAGSTYDSMTDVPTLTSATAANYCVLNPLSNLIGGNYPTMSNGNLSAAGAGNPTHIWGTFGIAAGDTTSWYWEGVCTSLDAARTYMGIIDPTTTTSAPGASYAFVDKAILSSTGAYFNTASGTAGGSAGTYTSYAVNDVVMVAYQNGKIWFGKNGTWMNSGNPAAGTGAIDTAVSTARTWIPYFGYNSSWTANFGQRPFTYTPPTGFVALNTYNL